MIKKKWHQQDSKKIYTHMHYMGAKKLILEYGTKQELEELMQFDFNHENALRLPGNSKDKLTNECRDVKKLPARDLTKLLILIDQGKLDSLRRGEAQLLAKINHLNPQTIKNRFNKGIRNKSLYTVPGIKQPLAKKARLYQQRHQVYSSYAKKFILKEATKAEKKFLLNLTKAVLQDKTPKLSALQFTEPKFIKLSKRPA